MLPKKKKVLLSVLLFVGFIDYFGIALTYPLFAFLLFDSSLGFVEEHASAALRGFYLGILLALYPLVQFFSAPILGMLSDRKGRRGLLLWTLVFTLVGYLIAICGIFFKSLFLLTFYRAIVGFAGGNTSIANAMIVDLSFLF